MAYRRFFVPEIRRGAAELTGSDAEHLVRVLRAEAGQIYEISDNRNLYRAEIEVARKSLVSFRILEKIEAAESSVHITLSAALFKFDHFELLIEKATELGVAVIQPFEATRTERGLAQASIKRSARWEKIALEASQQSRRIHLPVIEPSVRFAKAVETPANLRLLLDENPEATPFLQVLPAERRLSDRIALLLGPEGGWTEDERKQAVEASWLPCSLAQAILRAETAGIAALAVIQAVWRGLNEDL